jgi:hypothetical protein
MIMAYVKSMVDRHAQFGGDDKQPGNEDGPAAALLTALCTVFAAHSLSHWFCCAIYLTERGGGPSVALLTCCPHYNLSCFRSTTRLCCSIFVIE